MLSIKDLFVNIDNKQVLKGINLEIKKGQVHAIMGPNGSGKSTLANFLAGKSGIEYLSGGVKLDDSNLLEQPIETRAKNGLFLSFQQPAEIVGISFANMLHTAYKTKDKDISSVDFLKIIKEKVKILELPTNFYTKNVNSDLSGGQQKMGELLQMAVLDPTLAIIDEIDSGLDIDSLKLVANGLQKMKSKNKSSLIITHRQKILEYYKPDIVHILIEGRIVESGGAELVDFVEKNGYKKWLQK